MANPHNLFKYADACAKYPIEKMFTERSHRDENGCLIWDLARNPRGYGVYTIKRDYSLMVHRAMYWAVNGPIPDGLVVDHMCRIRACCEPTHLRLLTRAENTSDSKFSRRDRCARGHVYTDETTYRYTSANGVTRRHCRPCWRLMQARRNERRVSV